MAKSRPARAAAPTRKHLAREERERRQSRWIIGGAALAALLATGLLGFGYFNLAVLQPRQPIARVGETEISTGDFQLAVKFQRLQLVNQYVQTLQTMQFFAGDENTSAFFQNQLNQIKLQLDDHETLGREVLNDLIDDHIIREEAQRRGLSVAAAEVDAQIQESFGYFPNGTPTPTITPSLAPTDLITPTPTPLAPTPAPARTLSPRVTLTATSMPTATITPTLTATAGPSPTATATSTPRPTATPYTADAFQEDLASSLETLQESIGMSEDEFRRVQESRLHREKLFELMGAEVSHEQEQVRASHILVADEETANQVKARLDAGEDFASLATEFSIDETSKAQGGDLGWFGLGEKDLEFEEAAFNATLGTITGPVQTPDGWEIILVTGHEVRPISDDEFQQLRQQKFEDWLQEQRESERVEIFELWVDRIPQEPNLPAGIPEA